MMISTRGRYALRVMIDLAERAESGYIPMKDVAQRQGISLKYLEKILPVLSKNGLVAGVHGKGGGYQLTRQPKEYPIGEILRLTEGDLAPVQCVSANHTECNRSDCHSFPMWVGLNDLINRYFDAITLDDLLQGSPLPAPRFEASLKSGLSDPTPPEP
ncbi:MAG: RrF2 family transcriptional regulator [Clostridia bacterium]|nr:RrF2 family transcriptional regulator [Clostridia bacterium]MBQ5999951.1 RrF2 family transcriptional regulator [Clostridia bacterium]